MSFGSYWRAARAPRYSITFALPLFLLYEALAALVSHSALAGVRNGADVLLKTMFIGLGGRNGLLAFGVLSLGAAIALVVRDLRRHPGRLSGRILGGMMLESIAYAAVFGGVAATLTMLLLRPTLAVVQGGASPLERLPLATQLVVSLGAGVYEELLFRVLLVSGLTAAAFAVFRRRALANAIAIVVSALIFSAFHYVGPYGDTLTLPSFTFRAIAGLMFSGLYVARGFGITAWTHALYDVGLSLLA
ncbi:MAG: CPBP family intramembrane metalloprotease [Gemmatimonadetes bacterium]|nr:CPBP family intramembrane metalloprotease [Gemmatimonadota bacterium]